MSLANPLLDRFFEGKYVIVSTANILSQRIGGANPGGQQPQAANISALIFMDQDDKSALF